MSVVDPEYLRAAHEISMTADTPAASKDEAVNMNKLWTHPIAQRLHDLMQEWEKQPAHVEQTAICNAITEIGKRMEAHLNGIPYADTHVATLTAKLEAERANRTCNGNLQVAPAFLEEAARYFENRPTNGEDRAHWSNIQNAENCRKVAAHVATLTSKSDDLQARLEDVSAKLEAERAETRLAKALLASVQEINQSHQDFMQRLVENASDNQKKWDNLEASLTRETARADAAVAEAKALAVDAARYRWLRARDLDAIDKGGVFVGAMPQKVVANFDDCDRLVDQGMASDARATLAQPAAGETT